MRVAALALASVGLALAPAIAAEAADEVSVSADGTTWSSTLSNPLFGSMTGLVPQGSRSATLWVRNSSPTDVDLRITLDSITWTDLDYAEALTAGATAVGATGSTLQVSTAESCRMLLTGLTLQPGESIPVTITLELGDLTGNTGQNATVAMSLGVVVYESGGLTSPGSCAAPSVIVPLTPPGAGAPQPPIAPIEEPGAPSPQPSDPQPSVTPVSPAFRLTSLVDFNNSFLLWAFIAALIGGALFYLRQLLPWWRRAPDNDGVAE